MAIDKSKTKIGIKGKFYHKKHKEKQILNPAYNFKELKYDRGWGLNANRWIRRQGS
jgi:hypothetical protein